MEISVESDYNRGNLELEGLTTESYDLQDKEWSVEIYNAITGEKVFNQIVTGSSYTLSTTGWETGLYIVKVTIDNIILSEKIIIKS